MGRLNGICIGDCSRCELLANGEVDMIPCILDQIFQRSQKNEKEIENLKTMLKEKNKVEFSGVDNQETEIEEEV